MWAEDYVWKLLVIFLRTLFKSKGRVLCNWGADSQVVSWTVNVEVRGSSPRKGRNLFQDEGRKGGSRDDESMKIHNWDMHRNIKWHRQTANSNVENKYKVFKLLMFSSVEDLKTKAHQKERNLKWDFASKPSLYFVKCSRLYFLKLVPWTLNFPLH